MNKPDPTPPLEVIHSGHQNTRTNADGLVDYIPTPTINPGDALTDMRLEESLRRMLIGKFEPFAVSLKDAAAKDRYTGVEHQYTSAKGPELELALLQIPRWIIGNNNNISSLVPLGSAFAKGRVRIISQKQDLGAFGLQRVLNDWSAHYEVQAQFIPWSYIKDLSTGVFGAQEILALELQEQANELAEQKHLAEQSDAAAESEPGTRTIEIFLASSAEMREDRDDFELYFRQQNDRLREKGVYLKIVRWENFLDAMSETRLQSEYNEAVRASDIFVCLFKTKTGKFTEEEFDVAHEAFRTEGKPLVYTFFKEANVSTTGGKRDDLKSLWAFMDKLKGLGHYFTQYKGVEDLKLKFKDQLDELLDEGRL